jgi:hypothetical protein
MPFDTINKIFSSDIVGEVSLEVSEVIIKTIALYSCIRLYD